METPPQQRYHRKFSSSTLPRSRSSSNTLTRKKDLSVDEDSALNDMQRRADKQYEDQKKKEDMAMRYWEAKKIEEQEKYSDEENEYLSAKYKGKLIQADGSRSPRTKRGMLKKMAEYSGDARSNSTSNGFEAVKVWQDKFHDTEKQLKDSMLSNAQLYKEKAALVFQVESLKDRLEDSSQDYLELKSQLGREQSQVLHKQHGNETLQNEIENLKKQITFRDEFLERLGVHLPAGGEDGEVDAFVPPTQEMDSEEKEKLLKEIERLKDEIASMKSSSLLGDQQPKDIVQVSTRMVSEYKTKLQISEAENSRLEGLVTRLKGQVTRYKNQVKELEEREDELLKEKRRQAKEIRHLQSESEDLKTEADLLKKRIEQLKKRRDYGTDS